MPDDWKDQIGGHDAIYFGAVGWPEKIPDHVSLWGSLLLFRREFDQYVNLRPARLMPGIIAPVVRRDGSARQPGEIDMYIVRENTEGEYSSIGGRMYPGTEREIVMQETVMSRVGVDRVLKFAFELAQSRPKKHLTSATKSNGIAITMPYWDERVAEMAKAYPGVKLDKFHIDILTAHFVQRPDFFDVVVASNLFGDILSDLGPACTGTIGIAPSANLNPERKFPSLFEPVHGSAPDIAGREHRQSDRPDLVRRDDAGVPGPQGRRTTRCWRRSRRCCIPQAVRRARRTSAAPRARPTWGARSRPPVTPGRRFAPRKFAQCGTANRLQPAWNLAKTD